MAFYVGKTNLGPNFYPKLVQISKELGMKPEDLLAVMTSESGIQNNIGEDKFRGGGLIGFMPDTQKMLGFKGSPEDFLKLSGEQQLDYVKRFVQNKIQANGGQPFDSAAKYYVANFFPIALNLPGIKKGDPNAIFIEKNPETIKDPKTGKIWSKKYWDVGIKAHPHFEEVAYKENPLFWRNGMVPGAITFGDMMRQVAKNRKNPAYLNAIKTMVAQTGYQANSKDSDQFITSYKSPKKPTQELGGGLLDFLASKFVSWLEGLVGGGNKAMASDKSHLIIISGDDINAKLEYAQVLQSVLKEEIKCNAKIYCEGNNVELVSNMDDVDKEKLKDVCLLTSKIFRDATKKIGGLEVYGSVIVNEKSKYQELDIEIAEINRRIFKLKYARGKQ